MTRNLDERGLLRFKSNFNSEEYEDHMSRFKGLSTVVVATAVIAIGVTGCSNSETKQLPKAAQGLPNSDTINRIVKNGEIRAGVAIAIPWLGKDPKTGDYFGASARLTEELAKRLEVKVKWVPSSFDGVIAALQANQIDVIVAPLLKTPQRLKVIDMASFSQSGTCYLVKKDNTSINTTDDLNNPAVTIATFQGTGQATQVPALYPKAKFISRAQAAGEVAPWPEVASGKADAAPFDSPLAKVAASMHPDAKVIPKNCLDKPDMPTPVAAGFTKGDKGFEKFVGTTVSDIQKKLDSDVAKYSDPKYAGQ